MIRILTAASATLLARFTRASASAIPSICTLAQMNGSSKNDESLIGRRWNLTRHFGWDGPFSPAIDVEVADLALDCIEFQRKFEGKLQEDDHLADGIRQAEVLKVRMAKVSSFLELVYATQQDNDTLKSRVSNVATQMSKVQADHMTFFELEIAELPESFVNSKLEESKQSPKSDVHPLHFYTSYLKDVRKLRRHFLSKEVERALTVRYEWSSSKTVVDHFEKELANSLFPWPDSEPLNLNNIIAKTMGPDPKIRRLALRTINEGLKTNRIDSIAGLSLNMVAGSWHIENVERNFSSVRASRNLGNSIPDQVVEALLTAVRDTGVVLCKKYYAMKKSILMSIQPEMTEFNWADRNAPLTIATTQEEILTWEEAVKTVDAGYESFSPTMAKLFRKQIDEARIDVPSVNGKLGGAFCMGVAPGLGPFQLLNFNGKKRDVVTLAHESGHGCHFLLAYEQGYLQYHPSVPLAEVASIFGEMIVFRDVLNKAKDDRERLSMLLFKIDEVINVVVRQASFDEFEELVHKARANGMIPDEDFSKLWMQVIKQYYGEAGEVFDKYEDTSNLWAYVHHFHLMPFYVYGYAFADLVVGALYNAYMKQPQGFEENLLNLLKAGGTADFVEVLKPFGLDPMNPTFWADSLETHLGSLITDAKSVAQRLGLCA